MALTLNDQMFGRDPTCSSAWDNVHPGRKLHRKKRWLIKVLGRLSDSFMGLLVYFHS